MSRAHRRIADYAMIGDRRTAALVHRLGSVDWLCLPDFDSAACFAALLGDHKHGRWLLAPAEPARTTRAYVDGSLVLQTTHRGAHGTVTVTDFMPTLEGRTDVVRRVQGVEGSMRVRHEWIVRFGYGAIVPWVMRADGDGEMIRAISGPDMLVLRGPRLPEAAEGLRHADEFTVNQGDDLVFDLTWTPSYRPVPAPLDGVAHLDPTIQRSRAWLSALTYDGPFAEGVRTSVLVLRSLTHPDTGGIVAAPTTSLPEKLGGERNWDYRFCWLRDAALTMRAMLLVGLDEKAVQWRDWLLRAVAGDPTELQILYRLDGGRDALERELPHLPGFGGSRPVRVGNGAADQVQRDVLGEVMVSLQMLRDAGFAETEHSWNLQVALLDYLIHNWDEPDHGIWEIRGPRRRFTHSRVMVWVALDRAVAAAEGHGLPGPVDRWRRVRDQARAAVFDTGFDEATTSFTQHDQNTEVDASLLMMPLVGFIDATDPRFVGTVRRIEDELMVDGLLLRYRTTSGVDGLPGDEHPFLVCSFWLAAAHAMMGRTEDAAALLTRLGEVANDVGLLSEQYDPASGELMGNFPQALSHLGLVHAAAVLAACSGEAGDVQRARQDSNL